MLNGTSVAFLNMSLPFNIIKIFYLIEDFKRNNLSTIRHYNYPCFTINISFSSS